MPFHVQRLVAPRVNELLAALQGAVARARAHTEDSGSEAYAEKATAPGVDDWQRLLGDAALRPQGDHYWPCAWPEQGLIPRVIGVVWWTDSRGRQHWYVEAGEGWGGSNFLDYQPAERCHEPWAGDERLLFRHPLELLYPDVLLLRRERGGVSEWWALCGCGAFGAPADVGWAGPCCGACFARRAQGEATPPSEAGRRVATGVTDLAVAPEGGVVAFRREAAATGGPDGGRAGAPTLARWPPPLAPGQAPAWEVAAPAEPLRLCCGGPVVVAVGRRRVEVRALADGACLQTAVRTVRRPWRPGLWPVHENEPPCPLYGLLAGPDGRWLAELCEVEWWDRQNSPGTALRVRPLVGRLDFRRARWSAVGETTVLAPTPGGQFLLFGRRRDVVEVRDFGIGAVVHRLHVPDAVLIGGAAGAPDGSIVALVNLKGEPGVSLHRPALVRWDRPRRHRPAARRGWRGLFDRLRGRLPTEPPTRARPVALPDRAVLFGSVRSPDGQTVAAPADLHPYIDVEASAEGVVFWDAVTLEERGRVDFRQPVRHLAFTPDGETLLVLTADGSLRSWPWRELVDWSDSSLPPEGTNR
jgi:hypothetical protein